MKKQYVNIFVYVSLVFSFSFKTQAENINSINSPVALLSTKQIKKLPIQQQKEYLKALREMMTAAEEVQNSIYGNNIYGANTISESATYVIHQLFQKALAGQAWAVDTAATTAPMAAPAAQKKDCNAENEAAKQDNNSCLVAGNVGKFIGGKSRKPGKCTLGDKKIECATDSTKPTIKDGIACNNSLYPVKSGDNFIAACAPKNDLKNATFNCGGKSSIGDLMSSLLLDKAQTNDAKEAAINALKTTALNTRKACYNLVFTANDSNQCVYDPIKSTPKKLSQDQITTCEKFDSRFNEINNIVCNKTAQQDAEIKNLCAALKPPAPKPNPEDDEKIKCAGFVKKMDDLKSNIEKSCNEAGYKDGESTLAKIGRTVVQTSLNACYSQLMNCTTRTIPLRQVEDPGNAFQKPEVIDPCLLISNGSQNFSPKADNENALTDFNAKILELDSQCPILGSKLKDALGKYKSLKDKIDITKINNKTNCDEACKKSINDNYMDLGWANHNLEAVISEKSITKDCGKNKVPAENIADLAKANADLNDLITTGLYFQDPKSTRGVAAIIPNFTETKKNLGNWFSKDNKDAPSFNKCCKNGSSSGNWCKTTDGSDANKILGNTIKAPKPQTGEVATEFAR